MAERSKAADCKSVSIYSRWFESNFSHLSPSPLGVYYLKTNFTNTLASSPLKLSRLCVISSKSLVKPSLHKLINVSLYNVLGTDVQTMNFILNFKRLRFFPLARPRYSGETVFTTSLGCIAKFLNKGKSYTKNKAVFLLTGVLLRRILLYSGFMDMHLIINRTPIYFQEILTQIHAPSKSLYKHPFMPKKVIDESSDKIQHFDFKYVSFENTKSYGYTKWKKKGRLKRKITKRIFSLNRVID